MSLLNAMNISLKDVIEITPFPYIDKNPCGSQGGRGAIIPLKGDYPIDKKGNPMVFLAQINKEDLFFPWKGEGILQFYVSQDNLKDPSLEEEFSVVNINQQDSIIYCQVANPYTHGFVLLEKPHYFYFEKKRLPFPSCDHGFQDIYDEIFKTIHEIDDLDGSFFNECGKRTDHRIGGYPSFMKKKCKGYLLLHLALGKDLYQGGNTWVSFFTQDLDSIHGINCHIFRHSL